MDEKIRVFVIDSISFVRESMTWKKILNCALWKKHKQTKSMNLEKNELGSQGLEKIFKPENISFK